MSEFHTFIVPFDFSDHAGAALFAATDLAKRLSADLHLVHVIQRPPYAYGYGLHMGEVTPVSFNSNMQDVRNYAETKLNEIAREIENVPGKIETHVVEGGQIAAQIRGTAEKLGADLIAMGTHGRTGLAHVFLGSVAERTLRTAPCPVLTVQAPSAEDSGHGAEESGV